MRLLRLLLVYQKECPCVLFAWGKQVTSDHRICRISLALSVFRSCVEGLQEPPAVLHRDAAISIVENPTAKLQHLAIFRMAL
jgi:hypothetical protein